GDAVDGAFGAGAGIEVTVGVEGKGGDVEQVVDERPDLEVAVDAEDGDGDALAARAGDHGEEVVVLVDGGVGDEVELFRHRHADVGVEDVGGEAVAVQDE